MTRPSGYTHLSYHPRRWLSMLLEKGLSLRACAEIMGCHHSTLSREIRRNGIRRGRKIVYDPVIAYLKAIIRRHSPKHYKILRDKQLYSFIESRLRRGWSPQDIAGFLKRMQFMSTISHEAIYQFIYEYQRDWIELLPRGKRRRTRRKNIYRNRQKTRIPGRKSIDLRPGYVEKRKVFGHFEVDLMVSRQSKDAVLMIIERKTRYIMCQKIPRKTAECVRDSIIELLHPYKKYVKSLTYDNGLENVLHQEINKKLKCNSYFCNPYHSWEKGSVEHAIGMLRRFIPKRTDLREVSEKDLKYYEHLLNNKPRKILDYYMPKEVFEGRRCT